MRITVGQLRRIIKEELLRESESVKPRDPKTWRAGINFKLLMTNPEDQVEYEHITLDKEPGYKQRPNGHWFFLSKKEQSVLDNAKGSPEVAKELLKLKILQYEFFKTPCVRVGDCGTTEGLQSILKDFWDRSVKEPDMKALFTAAGVNKPADLEEYILSSDRGTIGFTKGYDAVRGPLKYEPLPVHSSHHRPDSEYYGARGWTGRPRL